MVWHRERFTLVNDRLICIREGQTVSFGRPDGTRDHYRCVRVLNAAYGGAVFEDMADDYQEPDDWYAAEVARMAERAPA